MCAKDKPYSITISPLEWVFASTSLLHIRTPLTTHPTCSRLSERKSWRRHLARADARAHRKWIHADRPSIAWRWNRDCCTCAIVPRWGYSFPAAVFTPRKNCFDSILACCVCCLEGDSWIQTMGLMNRQSWFSLSVSLCLCLCLSGSLSPLRMPVVEWMRVSWSCYCSCLVWFC